MAESLADLYIALTAQTAPFVTALEEAAASAEAAAAAIKTAIDEITGAQEKVAAAGAADDEAAAGLERVGTAAKSAAEGMQTLSAAAGEAEAAEAKLLESFNEITIEMKAIRDDADGAATGLKAMGAAADEAATGMDAAGKASETTAAKVDATTAATTTATKSLGGVEAAGVAAGAGVKQAGDGAEEAKTKYGGLGSVFSMVKDNWELLVGGAVAGSVKSAASYEQLITQLETSSGELHSNLGVDYQGIINISNATGASLKEIGPAAKIVVDQGYQGKDAMTVLSAAIKGGVDEGADYSDMARTITEVMKDYSFGFDKATSVTNMLVEAMKHGVTTMPQLAAASSTLLPSAAAIKESIPDALALFDVMTTHGINAKNATLDLNHVMQSMVKPTIPMITAFTALGLTQEQLSKEMGKDGFSGVLDMVHDRITAQTGPDGKVMIDWLNKSKDAAAATRKEFDLLPSSLQKIAQQVESGKMSDKDFTEAIKNQPENVKKMATQWLSSFNVNHEFSALAAKYPGGLDPGAMANMALGGILGEKVYASTTNREDADAVRKYKAQIGGAGQDNKDVHGFKESMGTFTNTLKRLERTVQNAFTQFAGYLLPSLTKFLGLIAGHTTTLKVFVEVLAGLATLKLATTVVKGLGKAATSLLSPVKTGIGALGDLGKSLKSAFSGDWKQAWSSLKDAFKPSRNKQAEEDLAGAGKGKGAGGTRAAREVTITAEKCTVNCQMCQEKSRTSEPAAGGAGGAGKAGREVEEAEGAAGGAATAEKDAVALGHEAKAIEGVASKAKELEAGASDMGKGLAVIDKGGKDLSKVGKDLAVVEKGGKDLATVGGEAEKAGGVFSRLGGVFSRLTAPVTGLASKIKGGLLTAVRGAGPAFGVLKQAAEDGLVNVARRGGEAWRGLQSKIGGIGSKISEFVGKSKIASLATKAWSVVQAGFNLVMDANPIGLVILAIAALVAGVVYAYTHFKTFRDVVNDVFKAVAAAAMWLWHNIFEPVWNGIMGVVKGAIDYVKGVITVGLDLITGKWGKAWSDAKAAFGRILHDLLGDASNGIANLEHTILSAVSNAGSWLLDAGRNVVMGLVHGITNAIGSIGSAMGSVASKIRSFLPFSPAKEGPLSGSGNPEIAGGVIGRMVATGIAGSLPLVATAATGLAAATTTPLTSGALAGLGPPVAGVGGQTVVHNHITIQGHVLAERNLRDLTERLDLQRGMRNAQTYPPYGFSQR